MAMKGNTLLTAVAVLALAPVLFAIIAPADESEAVDEFAFDDDYIDPEEFTDDIAMGIDDGFYISKDTTVKMQGFNESVATLGIIPFLVQNGVSLTLDFKSSWWL